MEEKQQKKRLLWVGDAGCPSGFAVATHQILETLRQEYEVFVLGMNYLGDPHQYEYKMYVAGVGGDVGGVGRIQQLCRDVKPDIIVVQQDGWNVPFYVDRLRQRLPNGKYRYPDFAKIPIVAAVAVDGKNFNGEWLTGIDLAIFWTQFALDEARTGGYRGRARVIPLGVNLETFKPLDKQEARATHMIPEVVRAGFIVGNVNRNQPRKRFDLTIKYFAKWITDYDVNDAWLYLHAAPTGDMVVDVMGLARYYNCLDRTILLEPPAYYGISEDELCKTYNIFDVCISTTQGEGMGLPAMESMACNVPCLLPDWSAYGEWARDAAVLVPCTSTRVDFPYQNVIGGVVDEAEFIDQLNLLYKDSTWRMAVASAGHRRVSESRFRWRSIGQEYAKALAALFVEEEPVDTTAQQVAAQAMHDRLVERRLSILRGETVA